MTILNDTRLNDFHDRVTKLGRKEGEGQNARPDFGVALFEAAADGLIVVGKAEDNAVLKEVRRYSEAAKSKRVTFKGNDAVNKKSEKAQTSKANKLVQCGGLPIFLASRNGDTIDVAKNWMDLVKQQIAKLDATSEKAVPVYDKLVAVAREQVKKEKQSEALTEAQIWEVITRKGDPATELKLLKQIFGKLGKLAEGLKDSAEYLEAAQSQLTPRIAELEDEEGDAERDKQVAAMTPEELEKMEAKIMAAKQAAAMKMAAE